MTEHPAWQYFLHPYLAYRLLGQPTTPEAKACSAAADAELQVTFYLAH